MNSSDPLVKDGGMVSNRGARETSLALHRRNSVQRERLDLELRRLDKEQQKCIRRSHLEICSISRDKKCLVNDLSMLSLSDTMSEGAGEQDFVEETVIDEAKKSSIAEPKRRAFTSALPNPTTMTRRVSLPAIFPDGNHNVSMATKKEKQNLFLDQKMTREISRLKKASVRAGKECQEADSIRTGKPNIPTNAWYHDRENAATARRKSVFDRLSSNSNMNSMSCGDFLQSVRKRRTYTVPISPKLPRKSERK